MKQRDNAFCKMFKERNRLKVVLFLLSAFSVIAISLVFLSLSIGKPHMGIIIASDDQSWVVTMVDSNGLANQAGIEAGDHPVKINDQPAEIFLDKYRDAGTVFGQLITNLTVIN